MSKHTPGPWVVKHDVVIYGRDSFTIIGSAGTGNLHRPDEIANANLIAAAPDLLEALEGMLYRYTGLVNCGDCGSWDPESEVEVIDARKAIARAKGQSK